MKDATTKQSRRVGWFLVGLLVAIIVEIAVDWNATFYEITVLRASLQQKGENYADILRQAATDAMLAYDWDALDRLSARLFDDDDVVYVRFTDVLGNTIYDRLRVDFGNEFKKKRGASFRVQYRRVMDRDARGIISDPVALKQRYEASRHKDIIQKFNDLQMSLVRRFSTPKAGPEEVARTLYQDRLADREGGLDRSVSYSVGAVTNELGDPFGTILIAFRHDRLNSGTRMKLWKGSAITLFFVGLIIFQNISARRSKLRLEALERALAQARGAVAAVEKLPDPQSGVALHRISMPNDVGGSLCITRPRGDGGTLVLLAEPTQPGIEAAFAQVALAAAFANLDAALIDKSVRATISELRRAYEAAANRAPVELALLSVGPEQVTGEVTAGVQIWEADRLIEAIASPGGAQPDGKPTAIPATAAFSRPRTKLLAISLLRTELLESIVTSPAGIAAELKKAWDEEAWSIRQRDAWLLVLAPVPPKATENV